MTQLLQHTLTFWDQSLQIVDFDWSLTPEMVQRDMRLDTHGVNNLEPSPRVVLDLGANVGIWAIAMAKRYPDATIYAVEPASYNLENMVRNIELNHVTNVIPILGAVYSENTEIALQQSEINSGSLSHFGPESKMPEVTVLASTLDQLLLDLNLKTVDLVKMDIEGCEYQVLMAFQSWWKIRKLSLECHAMPLHEDKEESLRLSQFLMEKMYCSLVNELGRENICLQTLEHEYVWGVKKKL